MVLSLLFMCVVMVVVVRVESKRSPARVTPDEYTLEFEDKRRMVAALLICLPPLVLSLQRTLSPTSRTGTKALVWGSACGACILLGVWLYVLASRRYRLTRQELLVQELWGAEKRFSWTMLSRVSVLPVLQWLQLDFGVRRVSLSRHLSGFGILPRALRQFAPTVLARAPEAQAFLAPLGDVPFPGSTPSSGKETLGATPSDRADQQRDSTGVGYDRLVRAFEPTFTEQVATWPIVCVLPMGGANEAQDAPLGPVLAGLLRRDLGLAGSISVLDTGEEGGLTFTELLKHVNETGEVGLPWNYVAAVGHGHEGVDLVLYGYLWKTDTQGKPLELRVQGFADSVGALTAQLAEAFAEALGLPITPEIREQWQKARPRSFAAFTATARACAADDTAWIVSAFARGEVHPNALTLVSDEDGAPGYTARARASLADPADAQLTFMLFTEWWKGGGRDSAAARVLIGGLRAAPGHGKSQMCMAHLFQRTPANARHILAHAAAGERLLPGNPYAISNYLGYLDTFAPQHPRRRELVERLLVHWPDHPSALRTAMDFFLAEGDPQRALKVARHFESLCVEPVSPRMLYALKQNPAMAAALESGRKTPLDEARRCVAICEKAVRKQTFN